MRPRAAQLRRASRRALPRLHLRLLDLGWSPRHADRISQELVAQYGWTPSDLVVEVASNDGTVLHAFKKRGVRVLGVEPARNIAAIANDAGVPTIPEFFNVASARAVVDRHGRAAAILGRHVFAHVDDVHEFMDAVTHVLAEDGVLSWRCHTSAIFS